LHLPEGRELSSVRGSHSIDELQFVLASIGAIGLASGID